MKDEPTYETDSVETVLNAIAIGVLVFTCSIAIAMQGAQVFSS